MSRTGQRVAIITGRHSLVGSPRASHYAESQSPEGVRRVIARLADDPALNSMTRPALSVTERAERYQIDVRA